VGVLLVTSNRGLCGAYNTFVMKRGLQRVQELNKQGIVPKIVVVGKKGRNQMNTRWKNAGAKFNFTGTFFDFPDSITAKSSSEISDAVRNLFLSGEVDKVEVFYTKFITLISSEAMIRSMLPLTPTGIEDPEDETFKITSEEGKLKVEKKKVKAAKAKDIEPDVIFDQAPETILNSMLPLYLNSQLISILFDSQAAELSSRMTAMKAATDNASELQKQLTLLFNKKRQAGITQELLEICAGAMTLEDKVEKGGPALSLDVNKDTLSEELMAEIESGSVPDSPPLP